MADRRPKSTQPPPLRSGKVIPFRIPANLPSAREPVEEQQGFDFLAAEEQERKDADE